MKLIAKLIGERNVVRAAFMTPVLPTDTHEET